MSTTKTKAQPAKTPAKERVNAMTVAANTTAVAIADDEIDDGDLGYSTNANDSLIPIISIVQDQSAEVKTKHSKFIEGIESGNLIVRSLKLVFVDAITFQPCGFQHVWVEWQGETGAGVPVMQYPFEEKPNDAREVPDPQNEGKSIWRRKNGNRLVDTRYHFGHMLRGDAPPLPCVLPMSGTNHGVSKGWTSLMKEKRVPRTDQRAPAWFCLYKIDTIFTERGSQSWFKYNITDGGWVQSRDLRDAGKALNKSVVAGAVKADVEAEAEAIGEDNDAI